MNPPELNIAVTVACRRFSISTELLKQAQAMGTRIGTSPHSHRPDNVHSILFIPMENIAVTASDYSTIIASCPLLVFCTTYKDSRCSKIIKATLVEGADYYSVDSPPHTPGV